MLPVGVVVVVGTLLFLMPRTSFVGAIRLTGVVVWIVTELRQTAVFALTFGRARASKSDV